MRPLAYRDESRLYGCVPSGSTHPSPSGRQLRDDMTRLGVMLLLVLTLAGCGQKGNGSGGDPEMDATLTHLTKELHHAMAGRKLERNFDAFVELTHIEVPPPPPGKKYSINERWKVILVNN